MPQLSELFDSYNRRARLAPALLTVLPALPYALVQLPGLAQVTEGTKWLGLLVPLFITCGLPLFMTNVVRSRGKATEARLLRTWGAFPTTLALRHRDDGSPAHREHRRAHLERLTGAALPTPADEEADPVGADHRYRLAIDRLIARVRAQRDDFPLVTEENIHYGFRRNLLGMKGYALALLGGCFAIDFILIVDAVSPVASLIDISRQSAMIPSVFHMIWAFAFTFHVREGWVREAAQDYSVRLYSALDDPRFGRT